MKKTNIKLDSQEKRIEKEIKKGEYSSTPNLKETKKMFAEAARNYQELTKTKKITIRIKNEDLIKIKAKAKKNDIPYQTLLKALIKQYVEGQAKLQY